MMPKAHIVKVLLILLVLSINAVTGCAPASKGRTIAKKSQASKVSTSQLGRNKYYFSTNYQKKITRAHKK
jgi:hypothetical protein